jgi:predicted nuclease with RNAse H fold
MKVIGIDLSTKEKNQTGICIINRVVRFLKLKKDVEIINLIKNLKPDVVAIDAPLSLSKKSWRPCEIKLLKMGFRPLPLTMKNMRILAERAIRLKRMLGNFKVIEVFPRATEKILGIEKKKIQEMFFVKISEHQYDAYLCALTGKCFLENTYEIVGRKIVIPAKSL